MSGLVLSHTVMRCKTDDDTAGGGLKGVIVIQPALYSVRQ